MNKVMLFVALKIAEIGGIIFIPYFIGYIIDKFDIEYLDGFWKKWIVGAVILFLIVALVSFISINIGLVDVILN